MLRDGGEDLVDHGDGLLLVEGEDLGEQVEAVRQRFVRLQLREKRAEPRDARQTARETQKHNWIRGCRCLRVLPNTDISIKKKARFLEVQSTKKTARA